MPGVAVGRRNITNLHLLPPLLIVFELRVAVRAFSTAPRTWRPHAAEMSQRRSEYPSLIGIPESHFKRLQLRVDRAAFGSTGWPGIAHPCTRNGPTCRETHEPIASGRESQAGTNGQSSYQVPHGSVQVRLLRKRRVSSMVNEAVVAIAARPMAFRLRKTEWRLREVGRPNKLAERTNEFQVGRVVAHSFPHHNAHQVGRHHRRSLGARRIHRREVHGLTPTRRIGEPFSPQRADTTARMRFGDIPIERPVRVVAYSVNPPQSSRSTVVSAKR